MPALLASVAVAAPALAQGFATAAPIAIVEDYDSGAVLYEKNADQAMGLGQMVQLMTAEVVFDELAAGRIHLDDRYEVSQYAWRTGGGHGHSTSMFLDIHSQVSIENLIRGLAIQNGNDAAIVLAEGIAGSEGGLVTIMNKRAAELGLKDTLFANSYGKDDPDQKSTARDLARLAIRLIHDHPDYYRYFSEKDFTWDRIHQLNRNPLLAMGVGADGLKAGESAQSRFGLVGSAVEDGQRLIVVVNGLKTATERAEEARRLFDFGFHAFDPRLLFEAGETVGTASVYGGAQGRVELECVEPAKVFLPHGSTDRLLAKVVYTGPLMAPVAAGVEVGRLEVWRGKTLALEVPLKTKGAVAVGPLWRRALDAILEVVTDWVRRLFAKI